MSIFQTGLIEITLKNTSISSIPFDVFIYVTIILTSISFKSVNVLSVYPERFELSTNRLRVCCSTN